MKELEKIAEMVGQTYMYKKENYNIKGFIPGDQQVRIKTDKQDIVLLYDGLAHQLQYFLEVEQEQGETGLSVASHPSTDLIANLRNILLDNITKVQNDKEYVQQAGVVNKSVTNITNLVKAELEFIKLQQSK